MTPEISERALEAAIEQMYRDHGYGRVWAEATTRPGRNLDVDPICPSLEVVICISRQPKHKRENKRPATRVLPARATPNHAAIG